MNNNPNYVLKTNEAVLVSKESKGLHAMKVAVGIIVAVIVLGSLIFQENLFAEMTWTTRILLVVIA